MKSVDWNLTETYSGLVSTCLLMITLISYCSTKFYSTFTIIAGLSGLDHKLKKQIPFCVWLLQIQTLPTSSAYFYHLNYHLQFLSVYELLLPYVQQTKCQQQSVVWRHSKGLGRDHWIHCTNRICLSASMTKWHLFRLMVNLSSSLSAHFSSCQFPPLLKSEQRAREEVKDKE